MVWPLVNSGIDVQTLDIEEREEHLAHRMDVIFANVQDYKDKGSLGREVQTRTGR